MKTPNSNLSGLGIHAKGPLMASSLMASLAVALGLSNAAPVIHESFNFVAPDTSLSGNAGGTGLSGNWTTTSTTAVEAANLTYGSLSTSGSAIVASGYNTSNARVGIGATTLNGLLNDGGGLWMSFLYRYGGNATTTRFAIGLGDSYLSSNGNLFDEDANAAIVEQAIGFAAVYNTGNGDIPMIWDTNTYDGSNINGDPTFALPPSTSPGLTSGSSSGYGFTPTNDTTYLVVLHAQWGADGSTNDTVTLYLPGTDLALGTAVTTYQAIVSQDSFDTLFFTADQTLGTLDEIRVGATYADVVPSTGGGSPYDTWATTKGLTGLPGSSTDPAKDADPDKDGRSNLGEFAFNGNPTSGSDNGMMAGLVQDASTPAGNELTLIVAVRNGATFADAGSPVVQTEAIDGVTYTIEGTLDLVTIPGSAVSHVGGPSNTAPSGSGLTADLTSADWKYHTFKLDASEGLGSKGFLRAKITSP